MTVNGTLAIAILGIAALFPFRGAGAVPISMELLTLKDPDSYEAFAYIPPAAASSSSEGGWPLLLYLHGAGEMGGKLQDIISEGATGTPPVALKQGKAVPELADNFVVVAPHTKRGWQPGVLSKFLDFLLGPALVDVGVSLDHTRFYVTGHSMGGAGALAAAAGTQRFAAVVPVAPSGRVKAAALRDMAVWAFHGRNDVIVPSEYSERLVDDLRQAGKPEKRARLTLYENAPAPPGWDTYYGHASTIPAYATPELYTWLLAHQLGPDGRVTEVPSSSKLADQDQEGTPSPSQLTGQNREAEL